MSLMKHILLLSLLLLSSMAFAQLFFEDGQS